MNEVIKAMRERVSCRSYKSDPVPQELIDQVIEAGLWAPSGMNTQSPIIIAITDKEIRDQLMEMNRSIIGWDQDPFYGAPVVLVVLASKASPICVYDGTCTMENMLLAAHSLGLGSCWIHRAKEEFESEEGKALLAKLGIEGEFEGIGHCILGYVDGELGAPKPRNDGRVFRI